MPKQLLATEQLAYCTVRISVEYADGRQGLGTGFFLQFLNEGQTHVPAIVTNKHVVQGAIKGKFYFNVADKEGDPMLRSHFWIGVEELQRSWYPHPDPSVDLCVLPMATMIDLNIS